MMLQHCQHTKPILSFGHKSDIILAQFGSNDSFKRSSTASDSLQFCNGDASGAASSGDASTATACMQFETVMPLVMPQVLPMERPPSKIPFNLSFNMQKNVHYVYTHAKTKTCMPKNKCILDSSENAFISGPENNRSKNVQHFHSNMYIKHICTMYMHTYICIYIHKMNYALHLYIHSFHRYLLI